MDAENDPANGLVLILANKGSSLLERQQAFEAIFNLPVGPWAQKPLPVFLKALAFEKAKRQMEKFHRKADEIDWEGAALETGLALFLKPPRNPSSLKPWLHQTVDNQINGLVTKFYSEVTRRDDRAFDDESMSLSTESAASEDEESQEIERMRIFYDSVIGAIAEAPKSLRIFAQLMLLDRYNDDQIREALRLSPAAFRKRLQRLREYLIEHPGPLAELMPRFAPRK